MEQELREVHVETVGADTRLRSRTSPLHTMRPNDVQVGFRYDAVARDVLFLRVLVLTGLYVYHSAACL